MSIYEKEGGGDPYVFRGGVGGGDSSDKLGKDRAALDLMGIFLCGEGRIPLYEI